MFWNLTFRGNLTKEKVTKDNDSKVLSGLNQILMWDRVMTATFANRFEVANFLSNNDRKQLESIVYDSVNNEFVVFYRPWLSV